MHVANVDFVMNIFKDLCKIFCENCIVKFGRYKVSLMLLVLKHCIVRFLLYLNRANLSQNYKRYYFLLRVGVSYVGLEVLLLAFMLRVKFSKFGYKPTVYYVPEKLVKPFMELHRTFSRVDINIKLIQLSFYK
ncbi:hypothetical protein AYJ00_07195 [Shewanella algae]|nr:hypothetical protein AYJ00_07195 [Shewanella algae]